MTTDGSRAAGLAAARRRAATATTTPARTRTRRKPGAVSALVATGATVGGGLALVGVMAAAARTPVTVAADTWSAAPATATPAGSEVVTIRRVVIPVAPDADGAGSTQQITTALPQAPAPPATVTGSAPVTRSNGS